MERRRRCSRLKAYQLSRRSSSGAALGTELVMRSTSLSFSVFLHPDAWNFILRGPGDEQDVFKHMLGCVVVFSVRTRVRLDPT